MLFEVEREDSVRKHSKRESQRQKLDGRTERHFISGDEKSFILLQVSHTLPSSSSDKSKIKLEGDKKQKTETKTMEF